jgi:hypothetical protein
VPYDLRRDIHVFVRYVRSREVKRLVRDNNLSKADSRRLAKLVSDPQAEEEVEANNDSSWVNYVDWQALKLGFVSYDTEGIYRGYTSRSPSYPDNYITFNAEEYEKFLDLPLIAQERRLLNLFLKNTDGCDSEFFHRGYFGRLGGFKRNGCRTKVVPTLDFPQARRFLLDLLRQCEVGVWYSTSSLVQYMKKNHRYFLIPKEPPPYKLGWREDKRRRYANFREGESRWDSDEVIPDDAPDGFERVEGRYIERFLESAPLTLGYVDVAYDDEPYQGIYPSINYLKAFRVTSRLVQTMVGNIPEPKVTVQPNFEIYVESAFYPVRVLDQLNPLTNLVSEDILTILKLDREKITAELAQDESLDVVALLNRLTDHKLPSNVERELREWGAYADKFTLYTGFALLEGSEDVLASDPLIDELTEERIVGEGEGEGEGENEVERTSSICIVRSPERLFEHLEEAERVPLWIEHPDAELAPVPPPARTRFTQEAPVTKSEPKEQVKLMRSTRITYHCPTAEFWETLQQALLDAKCPVKADDDELTLTLPGQYQGHVSDILEDLRDTYQIRVEDVSS